MNLCGICLTELCDSPKNLVWIENCYLCELAVTTAKITEPKPTSKCKMVTLRNN